MNMSAKTQERFMKIYLLVAEDPVFLRYFSLHLKWTIKMRRFYWIRLIIANRGPEGDCIRNIWLREGYPN